MADKRKEKCSISFEAAEQANKYKYPHPIIANAGSSCRSKGKSIRKLVLNRAVIVTETGGEKQFSKESHKHQTHFSQSLFSLSCTHLHKIKKEQRLFLYNPDFIKVGMLFKM